MGERTGSVSHLVGIDKVQDELALDGKLIRRLEGIVQELGKKRRAIMQSVMDEFGDVRGLDEKGRGDFEKRIQNELEEFRSIELEQLATVLDPRQLHRLQQIYHQAKGIAAALADEDFARSLEITENQQTEIQQISRQASADLRAAMRDARENRDVRAMRNASRESRLKVEKEILALLSEEQQNSLQELLGPRIELPPGRRGGRLSGRRERVDNAPKVGDVAPGFTLKSLDGDSETSLQSFRGNRPVVLMFGSYT